MTLILIVFSDTSVDEVRQGDQVVFGHVLGEGRQRSCGKAASSKIESESDGHEESGKSDNNND